MASEQQYDVVFRGDIAPGETLTVVRQRLGDLFRLDETRLNQLFSGRPVVLRRGLDQAGAERFRQVLEEAGALVQLRPGNDGEQPVAVGEAARAPTPPVGDSAADSFPTEGSSSAEGSPSAEGSFPVKGSASTELASARPGLEVAPPGTDMLRPGERRSVEPLELSLDHLSVAEPGSEVLLPEERRNIEPMELDVSHLSVMPVASGEA